MSPPGQASEFEIELFISRERNFVLHRNLELRLGEADIGGQRYAIASVRSPNFATYSPLADSLGRTSHDLLIDRDGDGVFLTSLYGQTEVLEDEVFEVINPFLINDRVYKLADVSATGDRLVIERSDQTIALAMGFEMPNVTVTSARQQCYRPDGAARQARGHQLVAHRLFALHRGDARAQRIG